jgi:hypothetical protein
LAFAVEVVGLEGEVAPGLVITDGLEAEVPGTFAGALLSDDLQPVVTKKSPKIRIPKMAE